MTKTLCLLALAACAAPSTSSETQALSSIVDNGSFETGDYTGWTLAENSGQPTFGTWGIAADGETIASGENVFDFADQLLVFEGSPGLPITYHATDGAFVAFQLQNGPENHRMFQTVSLPSCQPLLQWDMSYSNHFANGFDPANQYLAVNIRDPETDQVLATPFKTNPGDPIAIPTMTSFQVDLTAFSGQTVRLDVEQQVRMFYFDAAYDNLRVVCKGLGAVPGTLDFGTVPVGATTAPLTTAMTNFADVPLTMSSISIDSPFVVTDAPLLPLTLEPGESTQISAELVEAPSGPVAGTLVVTSDDPNGATTVALVATGGTLAPNLTITPSLDFGSVRVGTTSPPQLVHIENDGDGPGTIDSFQLLSPSFGVTAPELPLVLAPGTSVDVPVTFTPALDGPDSAQLTLFAAGVPLSTALTGVGVAPDIAVLPGAIDFGTVRVSTTSTPRTVTITNTGSDVLTVASFDTTGPFTASGATGVQVPPGGATTVDVTFMAGLAGPAVGTLAITSDAPSSPTIVALSGTGVAPILSVDTTPLDLGPQRVGTTGTKTIVVGNVGTAPLVVGSASVAPPFSVAPAGPLVVLPGGRASLVVTFAPSTTGLVSGSVEISTDAGSAEIAVAGTGVQPAVAATPPSHDFGDVRVGAASSSFTFSIANPGTDTLHVTAVTFPATFAPTLPVRLPVAVPPGGSMTFDVVFAPTHHVAYSSSFTVASDAGPAAFAITGRGVAPTLVASLDTLPFGPVAIGTTSSLSVQLANMGDAPATVSTVSVIGSTDFSIAPLSLPAVVPVGGSMTASVVFAPSDHGLRSAKVVVSSDAPPVSIAVAGTGSGARAVVAPASLDLGAANVGSPTTTRSVAVSNTGDVDLVVSTIVITGPAAADFTSTATLPVTVGPGASFALPFTLTPSAVGARTATATLVTTDPLVPSSQLALTGTGTSPAISVAPASLDFASVNLGGTIAKAFSVANTGTGPLTITSIDVGGVDAAQFSLAPIALPIVLAPSASATIHVSFAPSALGTADAAVTVLSDDPAGSAVAVPVTGAGTSPTMAVAPSDLDFGAQVVGHPSALQQVHVANLGTGPLTVTSLAITGLQATRFALVSPPPLPFSIAVGSEVVLSVRVTPAATGSDLAALEISTDAAAATISLAALGVATGLSVTPASIDFGSTHVPATTAPVTVTLTNLTADPMPLVDAVLGGGSPGAFSVSSVAGVLAPGASTTAVVTFAPAAAGVDAGTVTFAAKDSTIPQAVVTVGGKAVSTFVTADRDAVDFGTIEVGDHSGPKQVTLTNVTTAPITVASVVAADPQFVVDATMLAPIQPGQSASFTVTFAPTVEAASSSTVAITLAGATTPELVITVTGDGATPTDTASCSSTRSSSLWLAVCVVALCRRRRRR